LGPFLFILVAFPTSHNAILHQQHQSSLLVVKLNGELLLLRVF